MVDRKLDSARGFGATHTVNAQGEALTRAVLELTEGIGVDHAFVCIDPPATLLPAFRATQKAGNVVVTAITPDTVKQIDIPPLELFATQKAVMGAVYGFMSPRLQIPELLRLYRSGDLKLAELITRTYTLDEINQGYYDLDAGRTCAGWWCLPTEPRYDAGANQSDACMSLLRQPLIRLLAVNLTAGIAIAVLMLGGLMALNPGGLRDLILADREASPRSGC